MDVDFPLEFLVPGVPVSFQAARAASKARWKERVRTASTTALPEGHFATSERIAVTLFYFPADPMQGDVDNIAKLVLDALGSHVYFDDAQVERLVVQKFEPTNIFAFAEPSAVLEQALMGMKPVLYVRVSDDPFEDLR